MKLDKDTIVSLLRHGGHADKADAAEQQLPGQIDTDDPQHQSLLQRIGVDPQMLHGLADKLPQGVRDKLPGGLGKLLG